jgi:site-specific DNA-methyltransferase (adenine-specific)
MIIESLKSLAAPIDSLQGLPGNPRIGDVDAVAKSLEQFGQRKPIVVRKDDGTIIAGNHTWQAAKKLGWTEIAVAYVGDDDITAQAYALADNRTAELGSYDEQALKDLIDKVAAVDPDLVRTSGWSDDAVKELVDRIQSELPKAFNEDVVPELPIEAKTKLGDIYQLGKHRLICGDSTNIKVYDNLLGNEKVDLIFTDPPYGMSYGGGRAAGSTTKGALVKAHGMILNDDLQGNALINLIRNAICTASKYTNDNAALYACLTWRTYAEFEKALEESGYKVKACIVWDKKSIGLGNSNYRPQHEFIFYCGGEWYGDKSQSDVWYMSRGNTSDYMHPTQKPVELIERALINSSEQNNIVIDAFGGSGSTLIACHQTNRQARLIELDPKYCDVIVKRWENLTGEKAVLLNAKSA